MTYSCKNSERESRERKQSLEGSRRETCFLTCEKLENIEMLLTGKKGRKEDVRIARISITTGT